MDKAGEPDDTEKTPFWTRWMRPTGRIAASASIDRIVLLGSSWLYASNLVDTTDGASQFAFLLGAMAQIAN